jgi:hypothetical protein
MTCEHCGGLVEWKGPISNLTHTECLRCGGRNCQVPEYSPEEEEDDDSEAPDSPNGRMSSGGAA